MAAAAIEGVLRAQPAMAPAAQPPRGKWIRLAPFPQATGELLAAAVNGKLYAAQGLLPGFKPAGLVYEYDPAADSWRALPPMPTARGGGVAGVVGGKLYVIGGAAAMPGASTPVIRPRQPQRSLGTVEEFDPHTN